MTTRRPLGPMSDDLRPRQVAGPPRYASRTDKAVEYIAIANQADEIIGYVYANDEDDAAGWQARPAAGPAGMNAADPWIVMLLDAKARGIKPTAALDEMIRAGTDAPEDPRTHVVTGSRSSAPSLAALAELAGDAPEASTTPTARGG